MTEHQMKDLSESASKFVAISLDNVKHLVDRTADELGKADVIGANRRIAGQMLEGTKETFCRWADAAAKNEPLEAVRHWTTGTIENAKDTIKVASDESKRVNLFETGARITQEGLEFLRRQVDLSLDTSRDVGDAVNQALPMRIGVVSGARDNRRPGTVTRVEIEQEKATKAESHKK
jgi:hypothetical protein